MSKYKELPLSFSGQVWFSGPPQGTNMTVFLVLDTNQGIFKHYNTRSNYIDDLPPDYQILIQDLHTITLDNKDSEQKFAFSIKTKDTFMNYYCEFSDIRAEWYNKVLESINFFHLYLSDTDSSRATRPFDEENKGIRSDASDISEDASSWTDSIVTEDNFEKIEEIGAGSFGKVHKVVKKDSGETFALKILRKSVLKNRNLLNYSVSERKILKSMKHPFIIQLKWGFESQKHIFMVMEFCPYGDFTNILDHYQKLDESKAKFYISETILAIEYLHSLNYVYRDLKPSNLLIDKEGHIKLGDFGLAKENVTHDNPAMSFCGTSAYLPPEVLRNSGSYKPADIYLIGVNLFEMVTGKTPFFTADLGALYRAITSSKLKFPDGLSKEIKDLISLTMNKNPNNRPSIQKIKEHKFFSDIDWNALYRREIVPPISVDDLNKIISVECNYEKNIYEPII